MEKLTVPEAIVRAAYILGNGDANTNMGGLEAHGLIISNAMKEQAQIINEELGLLGASVGEIANALNRIADHLEKNENKPV